MQSRKWQLTINNPSEKGITHDVLRESLAKFTGMLYWCMCDETGSEGTYHTHVYFVLRTPTVHTIVENRFPSIHRKNVKGTFQQNRRFSHEKSQRVLSLLLCCAAVISMISVPSVAHAGFDDALAYGSETINKWLGSVHISAL